EIASAVRRCTACRLHRGRTQAVPGEGPINADVFLIGEAPGRDEDASGRPFVGAGGKVLEAALASARLPRKTVFITNVVKCRPPGNRAPRADEMDACRPYLLGQIEAVRPKMLVTLGSTALRGLPGPGSDLREARGKVLAVGEIPVLLTYHPAAVLYNRSLAGALRRDLQKAARLSRLPRTRIRSGRPRPARPTRVLRSSGAVVMRPDRRILLLRKRDERVWCLPKGTMEPGETVEDTALREVREETGLRVRLVRPLTEVRYAYYWPPHRRNYDKRVAYFLAIPVGGRLRPEAEFDRVRWVSRAEAMRLLHWRNDKDVVARAFAVPRSIRPSGGRRGPSRGARRSGRRPS
ncbi:MAG: uracil-DNA glycosylase family protein, partial [Thermoplasmata archaeon]